MLGDPSFYVGMRVGDQMKMLCIFLASLFLMCFFFSFTCFYNISSIDFFQQHFVVFNPKIGKFLEKCGFLGCIFGLHQSSTKQKAT